MIASNAAAADQFSSRSELLLQCLRLVGADESSIASGAKQVFSALSKQSGAALVLVSPPVISEMRVVAAKNDTVQYRVFEIAIGVCCTSNNMLMSIDETGFLNPLLEDIDSSDILIQLNALELLAELAAHQHGREYLSQKQIIQKLSNKLNQSVLDLLASLIVPGMLKFLGTFAQYQPEMLAEYPAFTDTVFHLIQDSDLPLQIVAIETVSYISTGNQGKRTLANLPGELLIEFVLFFKHRFH